MRHDELRLHPRFEETAQRLASISWCRSCGQPLPDSLKDSCRAVASAQHAIALLESDDWEAWSLDRQNDLSFFLHVKHVTRYQDWNRIAARAKAVLAPLEPAIVEGLNAAGLVGTSPLDTIRWDVVGALICAGFMDCKPPTALWKLLDVYESGYMPVGWSADHERVLVY